MSGTRGGRAMDAESANKAIAALLDEAGDTLHRVYRITDGVDDDWASWYADWLLRLSELPSMVDSAPVRSELVYMLVKLDKEHTASAAAEPWPEFYAARLLEHFRT